MSKIPQNIIDQVRDTAEIYEIVSEYVDLKQRGNNFFGLCPFHDEKTPSFSVSPEKEIFHCFGCGAGGNAITFLMDYEKISFIEAIGKIADKYGIDLNYEKNKTSLDLYAKLYEINIVAEKFFFEKDIVYNPKSENSYLYLAKIFSENGNEDEQEINLNNVLLLNPQNDEAIYMLIILKIKQVMKKNPLRNILNPDVEAARMCFFVIL